MKINLFSNNQMKIIAHRGNTEGPKPELENSPSYVLETLANGFDCEIDVWCIPDEDTWAPPKWYLGHDKPQYRVPEAFLKTPNLWLHAKNFEALARLKELGDLNYFWHEADSYAVTSKGYFWTCKPEKVNSWYLNQVVLMVPDITHEEAFKKHNLDPWYWTYCCNDWALGTPWWKKKDKVKT
jgi:hypothetical protein